LKFSRFFVKTKIKTIFAVEVPQEERLHQKVGGFLKSPGPCSRRWGSEKRRP